ncbi:heterokaryon incompatibility protein-domain-containing protein [Immersiella caudata]|uniref:Heterokaryon incompatibility protein-domain-containing protein n=1 Tax=Immersiella caudata TaxID=314043 RepID=A0AA40C3W6_9PEZI|nr:heterokaryon incompatibility protein-domain-containing protein [Immersiella caudata]
MAVTEPSARAGVASKVRALWVDVICINQNDIPERNAQVRRMPHMYRLAHRVLVWLSPGSPRSNLAMSTLHHLAKQVKVTGQGRIIGDLEAVEKEWYHNNQDLPYSDSTWRAIHRLFQRRINLASTKVTVQCGYSTIFWVMFRRRDLRSQIATIVGLAIYGAAASYTPLTMSIFDRECSDQRDRGFGLLRLMPPALRSRMPADYSLDVGEVYKRATLGQIEHFGRLDALRVCDDAGYDDRAVVAPSWFSSGVSRCVTRRVGNDGLDVVLSSFLGDGVDAIRSWSFPDLDIAVPHGGTHLDALAMTSCSMKIQERYPQQQRLPEFEGWRTYCEEVILDRNQTPEERGRREYFVTEQGYIGLGPLGMKVGMRFISVLLGYDSPVILREVSPDSYQAVGSALVYGLHDAIALLGPLPEHWSVRVRLELGGY